MTIYEFVALAKKWDELYGPVKEQLVAALDGEGIENQDPRAVRVIRGFLHGLLRDGVLEPEGIETILVDIKGMGL